MTLESTPPAAHEMRAEFDKFAHRYEETMARPCALSGESPEFYAEQRMRWCLRRLAPWLPFETALDFGCGTGGSLRFFVEILGCKKVLGIDPSVESLSVARQKHPNLPLELKTVSEFVPRADIPFAFCNGVFHHINPVERRSALDYVRACLAPKGIFAFWENNPWNPVVVYSMSLNEFDRYAKKLSAPHSVHLLKESGFSVEFVDFCSFFPRFAKKLRGLEPRIRWLPLGAQYLVLARKKE
jgi:SAM-dependent methyltransferase